jgi:hypothetical protein
MVYWTVSGRGIRRALMMRKKQLCVSSVYKCQASQISTFAKTDISDDMWYLSVFNLHYIVKKCKEGKYALLVYEAFRELFFIFKEGSSSSENLGWRLGTLEQWSSTWGTWKHLTEPLEPWTNSDPRTHEDSFQNWGAGMPETSSFISLTGQNRINNW